MRRRLQAQYDKDQITMAEHLEGQRGAAEPAHNHRNVTIERPAGVLEGILWHTAPSAPAAEEPRTHETAQSGSAAAPRLAAIVCHPHPLFGGTMHNKVVYNAAKELSSLGVPVLRFNFRGVGLSAGTHDNGRGEVDDARAALDYVGAQYPGVPLLAAGFSFGAWVGARAGCADGRVVEVAALGLPVNDASRDFGYFDRCAKPKLFIQGANDEHGSVQKLQALISGLQSRPSETRLVVIPGADHFFTGHIDEMRQALAQWLGGRYPAGAIQQK
jgi:alpha/beta superfamily hydrolase